MTTAPSTVPTVLMAKTPPTERPVRDTVQAVSAVTERAATYAERWSDHAPVTVRYNI